MSKVFSARVKDGVIVAEGLDLADGSLVTVAADDAGDEACEMTPHDLAELDAAEPVSFDEVLADMDRLAAAAG